MKDWKEGDHKVYCKSLVANANNITHGGGSKKEVKKYMAHLQTIEEAGKEFVMGKLDQLLVQAVMKVDCDILQSVAIIDLHPRQNRPIKLVSHHEFLEWYRERNPQDSVNAKNIVKSHSAKGRLVCAYTSYLDNACTISYLEKSLAPIGDSWQASQDDMRVKCERNRAFSIKKLTANMMPDGVALVANAAFVFEGQVVFNMGGGVVIDAASLDSSSDSKTD